MDKIPVLTITIEGDENGLSAQIHSHIMLHQDFVNKISNYVLTEVAHVIEQKNKKEKEVWSLIILNWKKL